MAPRRPPAGLSSRCSPGEKRNPPIRSPRRTAAQAIAAARRQIVDGAVGMVKMALVELKEQDVVDLDEDKKAAMVSNLLVVLCGEENAQPVLNTGTLYN